MQEPFCPYAGTVLTFRKGLRIIDIATPLLFHSFGIARIRDVGTEEQLCMTDSGTRRLMRISYVFYCLLPFLLFSCEKNPLDSVDSQGAAPFLQSATVTPANFDLDVMSTSGSSYQITVALGALVNDPQGTSDIAAVTYVLWGPSGDAPLSRGTLAAIPGAPGTGPVTYSGNLAFAVTRAASGTYHIDINATDKAGHISTTISAAISIIKGKSAPVLSLPGARAIASAGSDSTLYALSIAADDSNGLSDVALVTVRALGSRDSSSVTLFDDGLKSHGDAVAGDGFFSALTWIKPRTSVQEVIFEFRAADREGNQSNVLQRQAANDPPRFVRFNVPSTIQRPTSGTSLISFFVAVADNNGLSDVDSVYFRNMSSATPVPVFMYDDGDLVTHGDSVAHDGTYSRTLSIDATTTPGTKLFQFSATDRSGARVDSTKTITIN
jgi:hypothetical protein